MDWRRKHYGRISGAAVEQCLATFKEIWNERTQWSAQNITGERWLESVQKLMLVPNWTIFYNDDLTTLIAKVVAVSRMTESVLAAAKSSNPAESLLDCLDAISDDAPEHPAAIPLAFAMIGNLDAIARYSRSINDMFSACKEGEIDSLFLALSVDSAISTMPFFQAALRLGQLSGDVSAAEAIFKALKGPHKKRLEYPELRWTEYLLRDQGAFEACTKQEIYELIVEHVKIYDVTGTKEDAKAALFKLFRSWQKEAGIQNPRFGFSGNKKA